MTTHEDWRETLVRTCELSAKQHRDQAAALWHDGRDFDALLEGIRAIDLEAAVLEYKDLKREEESK